MSKRLCFILAILSVIVLPSCLPQSQSANTSDPHMPYNAYLDGGDSTVGVILCHGRGRHPTYLVVDPLRKGIHERLGYHTLSLQMPVIEPAAQVNWQEYKSFFPEAHESIASGIRFLKNEKGVERIFLVGHSMGTRMASSFLAYYPNPDVFGFVGVGMRNGGDTPMDSLENLRSINIPVLDVYGEYSDRDVEHALQRSYLISEIYSQVSIPEAGHKFITRKNELVSAVVEWLVEINN